MKASPNINCRVSILLKTAFYLKRCTTENLPLNTYSAIKQIDIMLKKVINCTVFIVNINVFPLKCVCRSRVDCLSVEQTY